eukprot:3244139-Amphidinium_carterae.1
MRKPRACTTSLLDKRLIHCCFDLVLICMLRGQQRDLAFTKVATTKAHIQGAGRARKMGARVYYFENDP